MRSMAFVGENGLVGVIKSYTSYPVEEFALNMCSLGDNSNFQHQV
jgi:hypothetical protein